MLVIIDRNLFAFLCIHSDGASRSGLVAAALHLIEMMKVEQIVDVFLVCRYVIVNRLQAIVDQVRFVSAMQNIL